MNDLSICVFIKDNNAGAFCLWESMAMLMPLADEFIVWDLGSEDGTWEILKQIASKNKKLKIEQHKFPVNPITGRIDAGSFAVLPNQMIPTAKNDLVMYYQADEIFHEALVMRLSHRLEKPVGNLAFWRYHLTKNFQEIKQLPQIVHRIGRKDNFVFVDDGMNTAEFNGVEMCSDFTGAWFTQWGKEFSKGRKERVDENGNPYIYGEHFKEITEGKFPWLMPTYDMILDVGNTGGFLNNIEKKARNHAPFWGVADDSISIDGRMYNIDEWLKEQGEEWTETQTKFNIPEIMIPHLGERDYIVRKDLIEDLCNI